MPEHTPAPTPHRAVYGFAFYLLFFTLFILYTLWALLPTEQLGLHYLPDKYFALYVPILVLVGLSFFIFFIYPAINFALTPNIDEMASVVDVSLMQRHTCSDNRDAAEITSWTQLSCPELLPESTKKDSNKIMENCEICMETHRPATLKPIANLRIMDLSEINQSIFK